MGGGWGVGDGDAGSLPGFPGLPGGITGIFKILVGIAKHALEMRIQCFEGH